MAKKRIEQRIAIKYVLDALEKIKKEEGKMVSIYELQKKPEFNEWSYASLYRIIKDLELMGKVECKLRLIGSKAKKFVKVKDDTTKH